MNTHWRANFLISSFAVFSILFVLANHSFAFQTTTTRRTATPDRNLTTRTPPATAQGARGPKEQYAVVEVGAELQVISKSGINDLKNQIKQQYAADMKQYLQEKKDKKNTDLKKPVEKKFQMLKSTFKSQEDAQKWLEEKLKEREKGAGKKLTSAKW